MSVKTLTMAHSMWPQFIKSLSALLGHPDAGKCDHQLTIATELLKDTRRFDVDASLRWLENHGAYCDCEIMLNVVCGDTYCEDPDCDGKNCDGDD